MTAYYNENEPYAAAWLRELIETGQIAPGHVDERSIVDVRPGDLAGYDQCHFFAGLGGWSCALRLDGWSDDRPVWTGSCPCQPFSLAGKRTGFDDPRHLWPTWLGLIRECRPAIVFGEQVASAAAWLGLVRGDLEALEYAVGAMPIEAASAGADHLRDRFWFVAHQPGQQMGTTGQPRQRGDVVNDPSERRREGRPEHAIRSGRDAAASASGVGLADANHSGSQGRIVLPECPGERVAWPGRLSDSDGEPIRIEPGRRGGTHGAGARQRGDDSEIDVADADELGAGEGRQQRSGQQRGAGGDPQALDWVVGADGKARRVKPGIRLLAHGIPARVAKLRALGNAIDPRPAAQFIAAARECID